MSGFVHLHTHSYYSLLDGVPSPEELLIAARRAGYRSLALTDHNGLYGAVEFYQKAVELDVRPIIGAQLTFDQKHDLLLLVKDESGYQNLSALISQGRLRGGHNQFSLSYKDLINRSSGLICLSTGQKGLIYQLLLQRKTEEALKQARFLRGLFENDFYLELQHFSAHDSLVNIRLRDLSIEHKIPLAASNDVHFVQSRDWYLRRILHAIDANIVSDKVATAGNSERYLKSPAQMQELFQAFPKAVQNTVKIARDCRFEFQLGKPIFPSVELPRDESSFSWLWKKSFEGATRRYQPLTKKVTERLEYELKVIHELGFAEYFLIVKNIVDHCHQKHIPCVGRGSAADSLVSYVLEITQVDPIRHNLYFERFLNPERSDPPDIDLDICWKSRDAVIEYVYDTFGRERTAMICTFNTFQNRSAIRDVAKTFGLPDDEIAKITKHLPHRSIEQVEEAVNTLPELRELRHNLAVYEEILRIARRIADFPRHLSIHPGGVIIAPDQITRHVPLEVAGKGIVIAQYDMYSIEKLGLVKMDLLGVRSLTIVTETLQAIRTSKSFSGSGQAKKTHADLLLKNSADLSPLDLRTIPENDPQVTAYIRSGHTMGCFQLESPGMRGLLQKMKIEHVDDVIAAVALIRPGASGSGMKDVYIKRRAGLEAVTHLHPSLAVALDDTYGVIIYQEQVLQVAHFVAGLSLSQADTLRRAMTKSRSKKDFMRVHQAFMQGALNKGLNQKQADTVWQFLSQFVGYGFNKAHSATYGTIAYQTAFLKYYFPLQYMCAVLNNQGGFYGRMAYTEEARRMGIPLLPPDVNHSQENFSCEDGAIRCGLSPVTELTRNTIKRILTERPFADFFDFMQRSRAGEKEARHLIKAGALNSIHNNAPYLLLLNQLYFKNKKKSAIARYLGEEVHLQPFNTFQKILNEMEILDFSLSAHPLYLFREQLRELDCIHSDKLETAKGKSVLYCGWLVTSRRIETSKNQYMKFLTLEDTYGLCEAVLFPAAYLQFGHLIRGHGPYLVRGKIQSRLPGEANLIVDQLERLEMDKTVLEEKISNQDTVS